jgi:hypothetical protein
MDDGVGIPAPLEGPDPLAVQLLELEVDVTACRMTTPRPFMRAAISGGSDPFDANVIGSCDVAKVTAENGGTQSTV